MSEGFTKIFAIRIFGRRSVRASVRPFLSPLNNRSGQTMVEYLLLLVAAFLTTYLMMTGPIADFTLQMVEQVRSVTVNIVRSGEMRPRTLEPGQAGHPSDPARFKAEHL